MARKTIQIDLTSGLRTTIERPVRDLYEIGGVSFGEVTILDEIYLVRHSAALNQWRLCDSNGHYQRILFNPADLKEAK